MAGRLPVLWERLESAWREAIARFVHADLGRIAADRLALAGVESATAGDLPLGPGTLRLRGRVDRVLVGAQGTIIGDYKTGRSEKRLQDATSATAMLKGQALQVPLYLHLVPGATRVEVLGIHPDLDAGAAYATFAGFADEQVRQGFNETLSALLDLLRHGSFPLRPSERCEYCPYRTACRSEHPPTVVRDRIDADGRTYAAIGAKTARKPLLAQVDADD
jgi:ATP-dependent helicase/nuclease subunit B